MAADARINGFFLLTGATFAAFASGFGVCLFDLDTVGACLDVSNEWVDIFLDVGNHIIEWGIAIVHGAFR